MAGDLGISLYRNKNGEDTLNISFGGATLPEPSVANANFTNPGYNFKYWSTSRTDASSGTRYEAGTVTSQIPYGTNLYAIWEADYIDSIKTSDNIEHPIKDTISGYITSASVPSASSTTPKMDGTAAVGTETVFARGDHIHPTDTSRASLDIVAPEWAPNVDYWEWDSVIYQGQLYFCREAHVSSSTWDSSKWTPITVGGLAYTMMSEKIDDPSTKTSGQFLKYNGTTWVAGDVPEGSAASSTTPKMDGTASTGSENAFARGDHVHPTDTSRQAKITASGILKGDGSGGVTAATAGTDYMTPANVSGNYVPLSKSSGGSVVTITDSPLLNSNTFSIEAANGSYTSKLNLYIDPNTGVQSAYLKAGSNTLKVSNTTTTIKNVTTPSADGDAANKKYVDDSIGALDGGTIGTGSTTKTITSLSQSNGNVSATFSDIAFPVTSVNGQTGAVTTAEKFVITATAISGTEYYNLDKTYADISVAISGNKYVTIEDIDATYPYTTIISQGIVFGATLITTGEGNQLMAVTDGILVVPPDPPDSGTNAMGIAVHSTNSLPTMSDIPSASNTTPLMDGTADVGIQTYIYARADHVHPTDTSRQAVLISGTNIKTINNESILGSGNITIQGGSTDCKVEVVEYGDSTYANVTTALATGKPVFCHVSWNNIVCSYIGVVNNQYAFSNLGADESTVSLYVNSSNQWSYATSNLATRREVNAKQDELVSGTNIKTINNMSLLGSGNIDITGGGSSTLFVTVTYSNYTYTADTTYADMATAIARGKDIAVILVDATQQLSWYYAMVYAPKTTSENFCFATENELGLLKHLLVNVSDAWWTVDVNISDYAKKASPTFTGTPKAPTAAAGTNTTQIATTAFVKTAIDNAIGSAISASY